MKIYLSTNNGIYNIYSILNNTYSMVVAIRIDIHKTILYVQYICYIST